MVAVEDGEAEHTACDLLGLLLQLGQVLLGVICKRPGGSVEGQAGGRSLPHRSPTAYRERTPAHLCRQGAGETRQSQHLGPVRNRPPGLAGNMSSWMLCVLVTSGPCCQRLRALRQKRAEGCPVYTVMYSEGPRGYDPRPSSCEKRTKRQKTERRRSEVLWGGPLKSTS